MKFSKLKGLFLAAIGVLILDFVIRHFVKGEQRRDELRYWLEYQAHKLGLNNMKFQRL